MSVNGRANGLDGGVQNACEWDSTEMRRAAKSNGIETNRDDGVNGSGEGVGRGDGVKG